jgi:hypothetical protein
MKDKLFTILNHFNLLNKEYTPLAIGGAIVIGIIIGVIFAL